IQRDWIYALAIRACAVTRKDRAEAGAAAGDRKQTLERVGLGRVDRVQDRRLGRGLTVILVAPAEVAAPGDLPRVYGHRRDLMVLRGVDDADRCSVPPQVKCAAAFEIASEPAVGRRVAGGGVHRLIRVRLTERQGIGADDLAVEEMTERHVRELCR